MVCEDGDNKGVVLHHRWHPVLQNMVTLSIEKYRIFTISFTTEILQIISRSVYIFETTKYIFSSSVHIPTPPDHSLFPPPQQVSSEPMSLLCPRLLTHTTQPPFIFIFFPLREKWDKEKIPLASTDRGMGKISPSRSSAYRCCGRWWIGRPLDILGKEGQIPFRRKPMKLIESGPRKELKWIVLVEGEGFEFL